jgi:hypothetical protein
MVQVISELAQFYAYNGTAAQFHNEGRAGRNLVQV